MTNGKPKNSFSWGDALFLYIERPGQPLSIGCVCIFDGPISLKSCRDLVVSKLPLIPRYTQRVAFPPLNLGLPHWESDPNFDIDNHVRQVRLRGGTERDLKAFFSKLISTPLDRQRPLWDITLVQGLEGNRMALIARLHHCLADGISGVGIMSVLMDTSSALPRIRRKKHAAPAAPASNHDSGLLDSLVKSYSSAVKGVFTLQNEAMHLARNLLHDSQEPLADMMEIVPEVAAPAERLPFNVVCHGPQKFGWTEISMPEVKAIRERCGGTVNDVILTVAADALRRYSELRGVRVKGRSARIIIPVSVRGPGDVSELGNRISFCPVTVPLDQRNPQKLFAYVQQRTEYLKRVHAPEMVGFVGGLFSAIPTGVWAAMGPLVSQLPLSLCNMICTNIPGPQMPLYLLGRKMLAWYPYVPIGGEMGTNWAILSYNGNAYFGFTCDAGAVSDPESLEKFVEESFAALRKSAESVEMKAAPRKAMGQTESPARPAKRSSRRTGRTIPLAGAEKSTVRPRAQKKRAVRKTAAKRAKAPKMPVAQTRPITPKPAKATSSPTRLPVEVPAQPAAAVGA